MRTPNLAKKKVAVKRKSLNYKATCVTRSLFPDTKDSTNLKPCPLDKGKGKGQRKTEVKKILSKCVVKKTSWYCTVCKEDEEKDMRQCSSCSVWIHEECLGLTKFDQENILCLECQDSD
jgi:hypothetical protein